MSETAKAPVAGGLARALAGAQARAKAVEKDAQNTFHRYAYASAEAILGEAKLALEGSGIAVVPTSDTVERVGPEPSTLELRRVVTLVHQDGESLALSTVWPIVPDKGRPLDKAVASARTTSLAYLLRDLLLMPRVAEGEDMDHGSRDDRREESTRGPAGRRREAPREEPERAERATRPAAAPQEVPSAPALPAEQVFRSAESATLALVLERLQDPIVAQQLLDQKRDAGEVDAPLTAAVSKAAQGQGHTDAEIKNLWARVGKEPRKGAALVQIRAFVGLLPDRKVPA